MQLVAALRPDPVEELWRSADPVAVIWEGKGGERKGGEEERDIGKGSEGNGEGKDG